MKNFITAIENINAKGIFKPVFVVKSENRNTSQKDSLKFLVNDPDSGVKNINQLKIFELETNDFNLISKGLPVLETLWPRSQTLSKLNSIITLTKQNKTQ